MLNKLLFPLSFLAVSCMDYKDNLAPPKFHAGDFVDVTYGFYEGCAGLVTDYYAPLCKKNTLVEPEWRCDPIRYEVALHICGKSKDIRKSAVLPEDFLKKG